MKKQTEKRVVSAAHVEARAEDEGRKIIGYAALYDSPTDIGGMFREQIARGAFAEAIGRDDVRALIDHDASRVLGRTTAGTLRLSEDDKGLRVEIDPPDTQIARDLMVSLERGDINQMSFAFRVEQEQWDFDQEPPMRTVRAVELLDVSAVTYPAYEDTEVGLRSLEAAKAEHQPSQSAAIGAATRMRHAVKIRGIG